MQDIAQQGLEATGKAGQDSGHTYAPGRLGAWLTLVCAVSALLGWLLLGSNGTIASLLLGLAYISGSWLPLEATVAALRQGRPDINLLMLLAAWGSALLGNPVEGAGLLFLFTLSAALESYTMERARRSIDALKQLRPETVTLVAGDGSERIVSVDTVRPGDMLRIRPGERIGVDGEVLEGTSSVDESTLTGESLPVDKQPGSQVYAGTLSFNGSLLIRTTRPASESMIERIALMVEQAQAEQPAIQGRFERWQGTYVYFVILLTALTGLAHYLGWGGHARGDLAASLYAAMVFMVAASPCAVIMSIPAAVLSGLTRAARHGVLFKAGSYLEQLSHIQCLVLDKTGTLTHGEPEVVVVQDGADGNGDARALLQKAASVERFSEHPLAAAVVRAAAGSSLPHLAARTFHSHTGQGVHATLRDELGEQWVGIGNRLLFTEHGVDVPQQLWQRAEELREAGLTALIVGSQDGSGGVIAVADRLRSEAREALERMRALGIHRIVVLTGDHRIVGEAVGRAVGADEVLSEMLPEQKLASVKQLREQHGALAYIGDGVNDGPALAAADIGIAMGEAGTGVALETADVVLMRSDLRGLPFALWLARRTQAAILRGLVIAFGVIGFLLFAAAFLNIPLWLAVLLHEGSTVVTILSGTYLLVEPYKEQ
ncbi:heavy metal translocating P-type ATPase [bacterium]|nr:heavy metal translocating P-type ATPase [bacterium]